jgi:hypothetical protein
LCTLRSWFLFIVSLVLDPRTRYFSQAITLSNQSELEIFPEGYQMSWLPESGEAFLDGLTIAIKLNFQSWMDEHRSNYLINIPNEPPKLLALMSPGSAVFVSGPGWAIRISDSAVSLAGHWWLWLLRRPRRLAAT